MGFFRKKSTGFLGIDIGASAIKLVELERDGARARLRTYGFTEQSALFEHDGDTMDEKKIGQQVQTLHQQSGARTKQVIASLPTFSVFSSIITLPDASQKDLPMIIRAEAAKIVPKPLDEMILNWEILPDLPPGMRRSKAATHIVAGGQTPLVGDVLSRTTIAQKEQKHVYALITAAEKKLVAQYVAIFAAAGLILQSLETEAFALTRSLVGHDPSSLLLIDIGARTTDLSIVDGGVPVLNRSMDFGGNFFTDMIMKKINVSASVAEQLKRDMSIGGAREPIFDSFYTPLLNEVHYTIELYQSRHGIRIDKLIVTGGSGFLAHVVALLIQRFNITTILGDPWARVATSPDIAGVLSALGPRLSVAVGLAMRGIVHASR